MITPVDGEFAKCIIVTKPLTGGGKTTILDVCIEPIIGRNVESIIAKGMPLGTMDKVPYREVKCELKSGDVLVFMTDGIIEAEDHSGTLYSASGHLEQTIAGFTTDLPSTQMVEAIVNDVIRYSDGKAAEAHKRL